MTCTSDRPGSRAALVALAFLLAGASPALGGYLTMNLGGVVNANLPLNGWAVPTGVTTGNQATGIPFDVARYGADNFAGVWLAAAPGAEGGSLTISLSGLNVTGQAPIHALLNNGYGSFGVNEYDVTITAANGDRVTFHANGGIDTRDYNFNPDTTNTIGNTTVAWFDNGFGQRLDMRVFALPASFADQPLTAFTITQEHPTDLALFAGLTFSDTALIGSVPEPGGAAVFGLGLLGLGLARRRGGQGR